MNEMIKMVVVLTVLSSFSGGALALLRDNTSARIENQELALVKGPSVRSILDGAENDPVADRFKMEMNGSEKNIFVGKFDGKPTAVAFEVKGKGYGDVFGLMVAIDTTTDQLIGIGVTTHKETPGLGAAAKDDPSWAAQFEGLSVNDAMQVTGDGGTINAISGATITSRAVCDAATAAAQTYLQVKSELQTQLQQNIQ